MKFTAMVAFALIGFVIRRFRNDNTILHITNPVGGSAGKLADKLYYIESPVKGGFIYWHEMAHIIMGHCDDILPIGRYIENEIAADDYAASVLGADEVWFGLTALQLMFRDDDELRVRTARFVRSL